MDTVYHPIQKDSATFLRTHAQSGGRLTELRLDVEPGGGNGLHYHARFDEHFAPVSGTIHVQVGKTEHVLRPGDRAVAPRGVPHRWWNATAEPASVHVELHPGDAGFEEFIRIYYGLAADGHSNAKGVPKSLVQASFALVHGDINMVGKQRVLTPLLLVLHRVALWNGTAKALLRRYTGAPQATPTGDPAAAV